MKHFVSTAAPNPNSKTVLKTAQTDIESKINYTEKKQIPNRHLPKRGKGERG